MNVCWITVKVNDMEKSIKFYEEVLSLKCVDHFIKDNGSELAFMQADNLQLELVSKANVNDISIDQNIAVAFEVNDLNEMLNKVNTLNIEVIKGPIKGVGIEYFYILDPNGLKIQFVKKEKNNG